MFKKRNDRDTGSGGHGETGAGDISAPPLKPFSKKGSHHPSKPLSADSFRPDAPHRLADGPLLSRRTERARSGNTESKKLVVGHDICIKGEITSCDRLVVEGLVEAVLTDARSLEVTPNGFFNGIAQVREADISGRFEGELTADDKLTVRSGGKVSGTIRYGSIIIESGGEISGEMEALAETGLEEGAEGEAAIPRHKPSPKPLKKKK